MNPLLNEKAVLELTTLKRTKLRELLKSGDFPAPVAVSQCRIAWKSDAVQEWIDTLPIADSFQGEVRTAE